MDMIIAAILIGICQIVTFAGFVWVIRIWADRKQAQITAAINDELAKLVAGEPCQAGAVFNAIAKQMGQVAGVAAKAGIMGDLGQLTRAENITAKEEQLSMIAGQNPQLGAVLAGMGKRGSGKMLNNPFVQLALGALMNRGNGNSGDTATGAGGHSSIRSRLERQG